MMDYTLTCPRKQKKEGPPKWAPPFDIRCRVVKYAFEFNKEPFIDNKVPENPGFPFPCAGARIKK